MPIRSAFLAVGVVLATFCQTSGPAAAAETADVREPAEWVTLHQFESQAIRNYEFHNVAVGGVRELGDTLWLAARSPEFQQNRESCGSAAETLSYMVTGYYLAGLRREVPADWHFFAKRYMQLRSACLAALNLDESSYPLPRWFGR